MQSQLSNYTETTQMLHDANQSTFFMIGTLATNELKKQK